MTSSAPTARINSCSILFQNVFYMFSGQVVENGTTTPSKEFWKLDLATKQWQIIQTRFIPQASCQLYVTNQNTIMMAGKCQIKTLNLFIYNLATGVVAIPRNKLRPNYGMEHWWTTHCRKSRLPKAQQNSWFKTTYLSVTLLISTNQITKTKQQSNSKTATIYILWFMGYFRSW